MVRALLLTRSYPKIETFPRLGRSSADLARLMESESPLMLWDQHPQRGQREAFAYHQPGRYSYVGLLPKRTFQLRGGRLQTTAAQEAETNDEPLDGRDPFAILDERLQNAGPDRSSLESHFGIELPPFIGGGAGFISYDACRWLERIRGARGHAEQPDALLFEIDTLLVVDQQLDRLLLIAWPRQDDPAHSAAVAALTEKLRRPAAHVRPGPVLRTSGNDKPFQPALSKEAFMQMVERAKDYISAGDVFQVVLANTLRSACRPDPLRMYELLLCGNPSPYHFLIRRGEQSLVGASPEVMLCGMRLPDSCERIAAMRLVAGTYPRAEMREHETACREALRADPKEHAEHVMLVDHARNDIGRVSATGTVRVEGLCTVETYADVHHLVSQVSGSLLPEASMLDALRSCFPIATLTGTPKIRAMEIIAELEGPARGCFGGAVLLLGRDGFMDSGVIIRSAVIGAEGTTVQAGAGIVYDSNPAREFEECLWKAKAVLETAAQAELLP